MFTTESMTEVEHLLNETFGDDAADKPCYVIFDTRYDRADTTVVSFNT